MCPADDKLIIGTSLPPFALDVKCLNGISKETSRIFNQQKVCADTSITAKLVRIDLLHENGCRMRSHAILKRTKLLVLQLLGKDFSDEPSDPV